MILPHSFSHPSHVSTVGEPKPPARGAHDAAFSRSAALPKNGQRPSQSIEYGRPEFAIA